jgi:hypothetical protein
LFNASSRLPFRAPPHEFMVLTACHSGCSRAVFKAQAGSY